MRTWACALLLVAASLCLVCCGNPPEVKHTSGGWFDLGTERYTLASARVGNMGADEKGLRRMELSAFASTITANGITMSGTGAVLLFNLYSATDSLEDGVYDIEALVAIGSCDTARLTIYPKSGGDTLRYDMSGGFLQVTSLEWGKQLDWHMMATTGDSLVGRYTGQVFYNKHFDADTVGYLAIDTLKIALQQANVVQWGEFFTDNLYYYEYYFYSTDMRHTDAGKFYSGTMFVLGLHSASADGPTDGVYPVSKEYADQTTYYGNKSGSSFWGTYWSRFANGNSQSRGNIAKDSVTVQRDGSNYKFNFQLRDQLGNVVTGNYDGVVEPLMFPEAK